jgi:hypothetical protein
MVQIIENEQGAGQAEYIKFRVYQGTDRILADWQHSTTGPAKGPVEIATGELGIPVESQFQRAVTYAHERGVPFVWVDDPQGLFPPSARPDFRIRV